MLSGIRRIEALTGDIALKYLKQKEEQIKTLSSMLKVPLKILVGKIGELQQEYNKGHKKKFLSNILQKFFP